MTSYSHAIAQLYDELTGDHLHRVVDLLNGLAPRPGRALDVGCGTGSLVRRLTAAGWRAEGLDRSTGMIRRARTLDPDGRYSVGDATRFDRSAALDLVTATFDVVNHLASVAALRCFLRSAARSLSPRGLLLFDSVTPRDIDRNWADSLHYVRRPDWTLVRFARRLGPSRGELHDHYYIRTPGDLFRRHVQVQPIRAWPRASIESLLESSGFDSVKCIDARTLRAPRPACVRWIFLARRSLA